MHLDTAKFYAELTGALKQLVESADFQLPTEQASSALKLGTALLKWSSIEANFVVFSDFESKLIGSIEECIRCSMYKRKRYSSTCKALNRRRFWMKYHKLISSRETKEVWKNFLASSVQAEPCAILEQYVMQLLCDKQLLVVYPTSEASPALVEELTYSEENTLRYAAGYVVMSVKKALEKKKNDGLAASIEFLKSDDKQSYSSVWTKIIDRRGLTHISQDCYKFFFSVEMVIREFFHAENIEALQSQDITKTEVEGSIKEDVDVLFNWNECLPELEEKNKCFLMNLMISKYVRARGYSFANSFMEQFKQHNSMGTEKSKSLRKKLST